MPNSSARFMKICCAFAMSDWREKPSSPTSAPFLLQSPPTMKKLQSGQYSKTTCAPRITFPMTTEEITSEDIRALHSMRHAVKIFRELGSLIPPSQIEVFCAVASNPGKNIGDYAA